MPQHIEAVRRQSLRKLLKFLRQKLASEVPIYLARITGLNSASTSTRTTLIRGIIRETDTFSVWDSRAIEPIILFGYAPQFERGLAQLEEVTDALQEYTAVMFEGKAKIPNLPTREKRIVYSALLIDLFAEVTRRNEPESPLVPEIVIGEITRAHSDDQASFFHSILMPTGTVWYDPRTHNDWLATCNDLAGKNPVVYAMRTPLLTAMTRMARLMLSHSQKELAKAMKAEELRRTSERERDNGEWSTPMSKAEIMTRLKLKPRAFETFANQHGLKSINRQLWQIRLDGMDAGTRRKIETGK